MTQKIMYSVDEKVMPANQDLFKVEVLSEEEKTAKITGMNAKYLTKEGESYYAINHIDGEETLVIPYQVTIPGKEGNYEVKEVSLLSENTTDTNRSAWPLPDVRVIIYPNTVTKIYNGGRSWESATPNTSGGTMVLEEVVLSNQLKVIEDGGVFFSQDNLKTINLPSTLEYIGGATFSGCTSLNNVTIPSSVTSIGNYAFYRCTGLTNITIGNSVTSIGDRAFKECTGLTNITIPNSVTTIGSLAFAGWTAAQTINCEASSKPAGWDSEWDYYGYSNSRNANLNWGVTN